MAGEDPEYLARVKAEPCILADTGECRPPMEPHHPTFLRWTGHDARRAHDHLALPLCHGHHRELHDLAGYFKGFVRAGLRAWQRLRVIETRAKLGPCDCDNCEGSLSP